MQSNETVTIYSKFCVPCVRGDDFKELETYCRNRNVVVEIRRTTYQPAIHREATDIWGDDRYTMFLVLRNGMKYDFDYAMELIRSGVELFEKKDTGTKRPRIKKKPLTKGKAK